MLHKKSKKGPCIATGAQAGSAGLGGEAPQGGGKKGGTPAQTPVAPAPGVSYY
jgi:hypothetical protein